MVKIMIKIPSHSTIIAPNPMHLALYDLIIQQKQNTMDITLVSLSAFLKPFFPIQEKNTTLLYQAKEKLNTLSKDNAFIQNINEPDFLKECLSFLDWMHLYQVQLEDLPNQSVKEKDLKEILSLLFDLETSMFHAKDVIDHMRTMSFSHVYILLKQYGPLDQFWIHLLCEQGATILKTDPCLDPQYFATSNINKQAQWVAETILEQKQTAEDILISVDTESEKQALLFHLDHAKIPYTFLDQSLPHPFVQQWKACLTWILHPSLKQYLTMIQTIYEKDAQAPITYYTQFPDAFEKGPFLHNIEYEQNEILSEYDFQMAQALEQEAMRWIQEHSYLRAWTYENLVDIAQEIQSQHLHITNEDIQIMRSIQDVCQQAYPYLHANQDLNLLIDAIDSLRVVKSASKIQGILIGSRKDLCPIRPRFYCLGLHAKQFPGYSLQNGIFDETYFSKIQKLPSLATRIETQKQFLFETLSNCESLTCLTIQSTYEGKSIETSDELNQWLQKEPTFVNKPDSHIDERPSFSLTCADELFFPNHQFTGSISRLETMARCPLQHFLRYGLRLKEPKDANDIRVRGSILHHILETCVHQFQKQYTEISEKDLQDLVEKEYAFAQKVFPHQKKEFQIRMKETVLQVQLLFEQLHAFEKQWHMNPDQLESKLEASWTWNDITVHLVGFIDRIDASNSSFTILDYKSSDKDLAIQDFESGVSIQLPTYTLFYAHQSQKVPCGSFYISLKTSPISQEAVSLGYRKPVFTENETKNVLHSYTHQKRLKGWSYQDMSTYADDKKRFATKKDTPSFQEMGQQWQTIVDSLLKEIKTGNIYPKHAPNSCKYCAYQSICRQSAQEEIKSSRFNKEAL